MSGIGKVAKRELLAQWLELEIGSDSGAPRAAVGAVEPVAS